MSKLGEDGNPIYREDGKILKGPNYFKPRLGKIVRCSPLMNLPRKLASLELT
jgi:hypothetical protein